MWDRSDAKFNRKLSAGTTRNFLFEHRHRYTLLWCHFLYRHSGTGVLRVYFLFHRCLLPVVSRCVLLAVSRCVLPVVFGCTLPVVSGCVLAVVLGGVLPVVSRCVLPVLSGYVLPVLSRCVIPVVCRFDVVVWAEGLGSIQLQAAGKWQLRVQIINQRVWLKTNLQQDDVVVLKHRMTSFMTSLWMKCLWHHTDIWSSRTQITGWSPRPDVCFHRGIWWRADRERLWTSARCSLGNVFIGSGRRSVERGTDVLVAWCSPVSSHHSVLIRDENHEQFFQQCGSLRSDKLTELPNIFFTAEQEQTTEPVRPQKSQRVQTVLSWFLLPVSRR